MKGLTTKQAEGLRAINAGNVRMVKRGHAAFRIDGPVSPPVVGRLVSLGLAKWPKGPIGQQICEITDAGATALTADDGFMP